MALLYFIKYTSFFLTNFSILWMFSVIVTTGMNFDLTFY